MKPGWNNCFRHGAVKRSVAGLILLLWLNVIAFAALPRLHSALHRDASHAEHQCAITAVHQGKLHFSGPLVVSVEPLPAAPAEPAGFASLFLPAIPHRLAPGRAPPAAFAPLA